MSNIWNGRDSLTGEWPEDAARGVLDLSEFFKNGRRIPGFAIVQGFGCVPWQYRVGDRAPKRKLNEKQVVEIRERYAAGGVTQKQLASEYGVSQAAINVLLWGSTWRWTDGPVKFAGRRNLGRCARADYSNHAGMTGWTDRPDAA